MNFAQFWTLLQQNLNEGSKIRNWTAHGGYLGDSFEVSTVNARYVEISTPKAEMIQHISQKEFEKVSLLWDEYLIGKIPRHQIRDITRFSKYIISIMHRLDLND